MRLWFALLVAWAALGAAAAPLRHELLDDFRDTSAWLASASDQVQASARRDRDGSLCLDYDFAGVSGYAVLRRSLPVSWPAHFDLVARLKGAGATNDLQFKLVDSSGDNVWWMNRPNHALPAALRDLTIRRRHIGFAWGPAADRTLHKTQFAEFVVAAGREGGRGSLCVARLTLQERAPDPAVWPAPRVQNTDASSTLELGSAREFNGIALHWPAGAARGGGLDYDLQASADGHRWRTLRQVRGSDGGFDALFLPESETRHLRVKRLRGQGLPTVELQSADQWPALNSVITSLATELRRGHLPRAFVGEQNYWALVGVDGGGERSALMSEDGAIEIGRGGFSVEPAVIVDKGAPVTWADVALRQSLREGSLPLPAVHWQHPAFALDIEAAADGPRSTPTLLARYTLHNRSSAPRSFTLVLVLRPWQVNPPQQFLATQGGERPIAALRWQGGALRVDGRPVLPAQPPHSVTALPFDGGLGLDGLLAAPPLKALNDPQQHASAAMHFHVTLPPNGSHTIAWTAPLCAQATAMGGDIDARFDAAAAQWRARLNRVALDVPAEGQAVVDTLRTSLAHILMSRNGPALQPGTRSYARSWVRDGAMMVAGLVRLGEVEAAREFVDWFATRIFKSGKVPCCVDARGADPVVENDSHGQYLYAVAEVWRHSHDTAWLAGHWPRVLRVVAHLEGLRQSERSDRNRPAERARYFGLLPPSISHEGYSDRPAYAYWDDFWGLRGFKDAVLIARSLGHEAKARQWAGWRDEFEHDLAASISATAEHYRIGFIAGAADRGDFDATSTTVALNPAEAAVSPALLAGTFERYWQESLARTEGRRDSKDYTPYELRSVGALVRLGQNERAHAMLRFFFADQRPAGWNQWAEVVLPNPREVRFLGDMPHAWVSSDYVRSALDLFAYEREAGEVLIIGAGLKAEWLQQGSVAVRGLSTPYGTLDYRLERTAGGWTLRLPRAVGASLRLAWPAAGPLPQALHDGQALAWEGRELPLPPAPASVQLITVAAQLTSQSKP